MKKDVIRQVIVVVATLVTIVVNGLANSLPLNDLTTGEISDQFEVYFVPAGYVFSIWGLIYLGLLAYTVYQALPAQRESEPLRRTGYLYVGASLANVAWLFLWHYQVFALTVVAMLALLGFLIAIYLELGIGRQVVSIARRWCVHVPFSIYLGWITVATIANVTSLLEYWGWNGWGIYPEHWAVIMLVVGAIVTIAVSLTRGDIAYVAVIVWAFAGIAVKHAGTAVVATTAWIAAAVVALTLLAGVPRAMKRRMATDL
jgi:benzodiazapine receptor